MRCAQLRVGPDHMDAPNCAWALSIRAHAIDQPNGPFIWMPA
jgi:hypothetical protein